MYKNDKIIIRGAREHNLKNINVDIPKNKLVVITGVSGSGKSTLAFNTIYAEGQRRYIDSLSSYARQFLDIQKRPEVDSIEGLAPAISIEQKTTSKNPRSTVGTITEIYDYFRLLWSRIGIPYSPVTGLPITSQTIDEMVEQVLKISGKIYIMAPYVRGRKGEYKKELSFLIKQGYNRIIIDNELYNLTEAPALDKNKKHDIFVIIDRLTIENIDEELKSRIYSSFEASLRLLPNFVVVRKLETQEDILFSSKYACPVSGFTVPKLEPRLFSFNSPIGACSECGGLGVKLNIDVNAVVPDSSKSINEGAIAPWTKNGSILSHAHLFEALNKKYKIPLNKSWFSLTEEQKNIVLYGTGDEEITINWGGFVYKKSFEGVIPNLKRKFLESTDEIKKQELLKYQSKIVCPTCLGKKLNVQALSIKINNKDIVDVSNMNIKDCLNWFINLKNILNEKEKEISKLILNEIINRLTFLKNVGLSYLTLSRVSGTLSGGESQRIRLASQIGSGLSGVIYVLDEPSIGLHQSDNDKLVSTLKMLRDKGNSVIVVEHDADTMMASDYIIDMGRGAGEFGGEIIAEGTPQDIINNKNSLTGKYLSNKEKIDIPKKIRSGNGNFLTISGLCENNLKNITLSIPLGKFVTLTGVSGSGKSTALLGTLYPALIKSLYNTNIKAGKYTSLSGIENIDKVIDIDQSPIGRTPRSNPATYIGLFDNIRDFFAELPESKARGYTSRRFSFNVKGGRCEACSGNGQIKIEMNFLSDVYVECDKCKGEKYNSETLQVKYKNKSIADVLNMTVSEAYRFFINIPQIKRKLELLKRVGLDYIRLGQSALELSGGEAQRIKLTKELSSKSTGKTLYILDEPTTGLHFQDIKLLLSVLHELVNQGNTVVVIEHNLDVIKTADYIIDMGRGGGENGGEIVATGTPQDIINNENSLTGKYLKKYLE